MGALLSMTNGAWGGARSFGRAPPSLYLVISTEAHGVCETEKSPRNWFRYTLHHNIASPSLLGGVCMREHADGGGENFNNIFLFVILSDSEGSLCSTVTKFGRCFDNARSCYYCTRPYRRAARHDIGGRGVGARPRVELVISTKAGAQSAAAARRNLP